MARLGEPALGGIEQLGAHALAARGGCGGDRGDVGRPGDARRVEQEEAAGFAVHTRHQDDEFGSAAAGEAGIVIAAQSEPGITGGHELRAPWQVRGTGKIDGYFQHDGLWYLTES